MCENIFFSSANFDCACIKSFLAKAAELDIRNIELGANLEFCDADLEVLLKYAGSKMNFLIHNYFPPPEKEFVLNLASNNSSIIKKSVMLCKKAIDLSKVLNAPFYSVHAGFAFHARPVDLSKKQTNLPRFPKKEAYKIFLENVKELADYSKSKGIMLAIENNVVAGFNLCGGRNPLFLMAEPGEFVKFYSDVNSPNLFYLVDLGHLKVSSRSLGFKPADFLKEVIPYTVGFHLSDNDSILDQHLVFDDKVWFKDLIKKYPGKFFIIETRNAGLPAVRKTHKVIKSFFN